MESRPATGPTAPPGAGVAPQRGRADTEPVLRPLDRRVLPLWWCAGALAALQVVVVVALLDWAIPHPLPPWRVTQGVTLLLGVLVAVVPVVRYRRWRYALREDDLWIRRGVLTVTISVIPYRRLQFVDTRQGPLDRLFGLAQLVVHTAALGTSGRLPGLDAREAERLREALSRVEAGDAAV